MSSHDTSFGFPECQRSGRCNRRTFSIVTVSLVVASGCGFSDGASRSGNSVEILEGKDSAGATIQLEKRGDDLTRARVIDVVLGTGEAEIISDEEGQIEFTIDFPGGAAITYRGQQVDAGELDELMLSGTWRQHSGGVFGEDFGTWAAQSQLDDRPWTLPRCRAVPEFIRSQPRLTIACNCLCDTPFAVGTTEDEVALARGFSHIRTGA